MPCVTITGLYSAVIFLYELTLFIQLTQTDDVYSQSRTKSPITFVFIFLCTGMVCDIGRIAEKWSSNTWILVSNYKLRLHTGL